ncbi:MAG TPA: MoaD/ThiS family protein [Anaerolineales bacterium]|nr:MoaD/ThiS family protein [Anaerolineales bacterium]HRQ92655.1 MoaD/ThiS family protein [Anaerolineales bacterium]
MVRVQIPYHLRNLANVGSEVQLEVAAPITVERILDALEAAYPMLRGTIRDHASKQRRAYLRYFACQEDISFETTDTPLPAAVAEGRVPLIVMGAIAGG